MPVIPTCGRLRQEDYKIKGIARPCFTNPKSNGLLLKKVEGDDERNSTLLSV